MPPPITSRRDVSLAARIVRGTPLRYAVGSDVALGRPAYVRAGSGLARLDGRIAIIQDDALFVALLDPVSTEVSPVTLPAGEGGLLAGSGGSIGATGRHAMGSNRSMRSVNSTGSNCSRIWMIRPAMDRRACMTSASTIWVG